jgi:hypothetical protein
MPIKKPRTGRLVTGEDARELLAQLMALERATGLSWKSYFAAWLVNYYEETGNARIETDRTQPFRRWSLGHSRERSTAVCFVPAPASRSAVGPLKGVKKPSADGYVHFDIPTLWSDILDKAGRAFGTKKIGAHRLVALASSPPPVASEGEVFESAHWCGNESCAKHVAWIRRDRNQQQGACFKSDETSLQIPCNKHGTGQYCIREKAAARPSDLALVEVAVGSSESVYLTEKDPRVEVEASFFREVVKPILDSPTLTKEYLDWLDELSKVGGRSRWTAVKRFFRGDRSINMATAQYKENYKRLRELFETDESRYQTALQDFIKTPVKSPVRGVVVVPTTSTGPI